MSITITNSDGSREVNLSNDNFKHLFSIIGFDMKFEGSIDGGEVEIIKSRIDRIIDIIEEAPSEFEIATEISKVSNKAIVVKIGKDSDYYLRKYSELLVLFQNDIRFRWYWKEFMPKLFKLSDNEILKIVNGIDDDSGILIKESTLKRLIEKYVNENRIDEDEDGWFTTKKK